ncbi:Seven in absentia protein family [Popillia japonica]|uniref:E3 ubiquitin-protein ligase n=1 Tax=Popillia japonica TaxID=7064 RepID=A0AAW1JF58_POPJA
MSQNTDKEILSNLECQVCTEYMSRPIYMCHTGHSICSQCKIKLSGCPSCKAVFTTTRNYALESLSLLFSYPCPFTRYGCDVVQKKEDLKDHVKICPSRIRQCSFCQKDSSWKGPVNNLREHLTADHVAFLLSNGEEKPLKSHFYPNETLTYFLNDTHHAALFYFTQIYDNEKDMIRYFVRYIGDKQYAKTFKYTMSVYCKSDKSRKVKITEICVDDLVSYKEILNSGSYIGLPKTVVNSYSDAFLCLDVTYRDDQQSMETV